MKSAAQGITIVKNQRAFIPRPLHFVVMPSFSFWGGL
jgi:hypothetical protein